ncbi:hypothetical protein DI383_07135 [Flavobacteriaceae bacterium LYZ1037]|nr:hypothetical protein DI383_07135 [Flavobacteriaceae bacterium LYZ1037]
MEKNLPSGQAGKTGKYLKYAIGEIILVVIGILIALQLNNYKENEKLNDTRQKYYIQLVEDLHKDVQFSKNIINKLQIDRQAYNNYLEHFNNTELKPMEVYNELMALNILSSTIDFNSSTIESLRSSGELILFPLEIRSKLIDLLRMQEATLKIVADNDGGKSDLLMNLGLVRGASTLVNRLHNKPELKAYLNIEQNLPQIILGLEAAHKWKDISEKNTIHNLNEVIENIESIIDMIESEMKNN